MERVHQLQQARWHVMSAMRGAKCRAQTSVCVNVANSAAKRIYKSLTYQCACG